MQAKNRIIINWVLLVPIAIISSFLIRFPLHWILYYLLCGQGIIQFEKYPEAPEFILAPFVSGYVFVYAIGVVAPKRNLQLSLFFSFVWLFFAVIAIIYGLYRVNVYNNSFNEEFPYAGIPVLLGVIGAFLAYLEIKLKTSKNNKLRDADSSVDNINSEIIEKEITEAKEENNELKILLMAMLFLSILTLVFPIIRIGILYLIVTGLFVSFVIKFYKEGLKAIINKKVELFIFVLAILSLFYKVISDAFFSFGTIFFVIVLIIIFKKTPNKWNYNKTTWLLILIPILLTIFLNFERIQSLFQSK